MKIVLFPVNDSKAPKGKLYDVELHFLASGSILSGLRLVGLSIWASKNGPGHYVSFPARKSNDKYFDFLRPIEDPKAAQPLKDAILAEFEKLQAK